MPLLRDGAYVPSCTWIKLGLGQAWQEKQIAPDEGHLAALCKEERTFSTINLYVLLLPRRPGAYDSNLWDFGDPSATELVLLYKGPPTCLQYMFRLEIWVCRLIIMILTTIIAIFLFQNCLFTESRLYQSEFFFGNRIICSAYSWSHSGRKRMA